MVDIIIILFILLGAFVGFKRGFFSELVNVLGFIVAIICAFIFKNPISLFLYDHLPFFSFGGILKGVTAINILLYEVIAFLLTLTICLIVLKILKIFTRIFEKFLDATIILGIPSKIFGAILGAIEWIIISFAIMFVISLPIFNNRFVFESRIYDIMLKESAKYSKQINNTLEVFKEIDNLKEAYKNNEDKNSFNLDSLDLLLKYNIIDIKSAEKLYHKGKFRAINNIESVLDKYR